MERFLRGKLKDGRFQNLTATTSKTMKAIKGRGNKTTEWPFRMHLVRQGIRGWRMHPAAVTGKPDFFFASHRVAVFIDGCFWHGCPKCGHVPKNNREFWAAKLTRNKERDAGTTMALRREKIAVLRFWEHQVKEDCGACVSKLSRTLEKRTRGRRTSR